MTSSSFAQDYWAYIQPVDKPSVEDTAALENCYGASKKGDYIQFLPVTEQYTPTKREKEAFIIQKVSNITKEDINKHTEEWFVQDGLDDMGNPYMLMKAYRKYKVDIDTLELKKGLNETVKSFATLKANTTKKTALDIASYRRGYLRYAYIDKPIKKLANLIVPKAFAETVSTINVAGEDYNTFTLWEADKDGDLVTDTRQETGNLYNDQGDLDDTLTINDSITNATYYMMLSAPVGERHDGTDNGAATINPTTDTSAPIISIYDNYTRIQWLIIDGSSQSSGDDGIRTGTNDTSDYTYIMNNVIHHTRNSGIRILYDNRSEVYNNLVYECAYSGFGDYSADDIHIHGNNTAADNGSMGWSFSRCITFYNNLSTGHTTDYRAGVYCDDGTNNASSDATAPEQGTYYDNVSVTYANSAADDYHLVAGDTDVIDLAFDRGDGLFDTDIDGRDRDTEGDTWDIGADEYVSGASPTQVMGMLTKLRKRNKDHPRDAE